MPAVSGMKLVLKVALFKQRGEGAIRWQQAFLFSAGEKQVRHLDRVGGAGEHKRVIIAARLASPRSKDGAVKAPLLNSLDGKDGAERF